MNNSLCLVLLVKRVGGLLRLNDEGFRPPKRSQVFTPSAASDLLRALGICRPRNPARRPALDRHEWWLRDLATHLGMSQITLDSWIRRGWADGYLHPEARLIVVRADPARKLGFVV